MSIQKDAFILEFLDRLRRIPGLQNALHVILCEGNTGYAETIAEAVKARRNTCMVNDAQHMYGVYTTAANKFTRYGIGLQRRLMTGNVCFWRGVFACDPESHLSPAALLAQTREKLLDQLSRTVKRPCANGTMSFTGKMDHAGRRISGQNDDLVMALAILNFYMVAMSPNASGIFTLGKMAVIPQEFLRARIQRRGYEPTPYRSPGRAL